MEHDILIDENGDIKFVYADELAEVFAGERQETVRASHVEPHPTRTGWVADMRPSDGPVLGHGGEWSGGGLVGYDLQYIGMLDPFPTRAEALAAEREWLRREKGL